MDILATWMSELGAGIAGFFERPVWEVLRDVIDIGLVALTFYWGLLVLKGTRAMQMAVGMALLFVGYALARRFNLITIYQVLDALVTYFVLVVVVIFQADIRRALMRVGSGRSLFSRQRTARETQLLEDVIKGAQQLAQKRVGALIVFEKDAELDEFIDSGHVLDAAVTKELLYTLFIPSFENPMHDGAVIIRDGRIWKAGTFLPLAGGSLGDPNLGTRHRAALGISEETDAVVVVVSEERGAVSLCFNGNIVKNVEGDSLRDALFGLFYPNKERPAKAAPKKKKATKKKRPASGRTASGRTSLVPEELDDTEPAASATTARKGEDTVS